MATEIGYSVPDSSLDFWKKRFEELEVEHGEIGERFGEKFLPFRDPDGLDLLLIVPKNQDTRRAWETAEIKAEVGIRGFHTVTLALQDFRATAAVLTEVFGYELQEQEGNRYRYVTNSVENAEI